MFKIIFYTSGLFNRIHTYITLNKAITTTTTTTKALKDKKSKENL